MRTRLLKELRSIRLPLIAAFAAGLCLPHGQWFRAQGPPGDLFWHASLWTFVSALLIICSNIVGAELQQGTLPLLLSQPISRARLWSEKLALSGGSVLCLAAFGAWMIYLSESQWDNSLNYLLPLAVFATVCSCGFWTLVARSTLGGIVFTLAGEFAVLAILGGIASKLAPEEDLDKWLLLRPWLPISAGLTYSLLCLWGGYLTFEALELRASSFGEGSATATAEASLRPGGIRSHPAQGVRNLLRKEFFLQAPVLKIAALFVAYSLISLILVLVVPARRQWFEILFNIVFWFYVPLMTVLTAAISLSEEKSSGIHAWHLTLPIPAGRQWFIKLASSLGSFLVLGLCLPVVCALFVLLPAGSGWHGPAMGADFWLGLSAFFAMLFVLGFWGAGFFGNTVRSAFAAVLGLGVLGLCAAASVWLVQFLTIRFPGVDAVIVHWQLPPNYFASQRSEAIELVVATMAFLGFALWQSRAQFVRTDGSARLVAKKAGILAAAALGLCFAATLLDFTIHPNYEDTAPEVNDLRQALSDSRLDKVGYDTWTPLSPTEASHAIANWPRLQTWLGGSSLFVMRGGRNPRVQTESVLVSIQFPKSRIYQFSYEVEKK